MHALEPAEESLVAAHLPGCPTCIRVVAEAEQVGASLGLAVPEAIPSAGLEQRVLAVTTDRSAAPVVSLVRPAPPAVTPSRRWSGTRLLAAAAAAVLVALSVVLGVRVVQLDDQRGQAERQIAGMSEAIQRAADPASVRVPLVTTKDGSAAGMVLASRDGVAVVPSGLPNNRAAEQIYVLWGLGDGAPTALTAFDVGPDTSVLHAVPSATGAGQFNGYAISLEPGRSTPAVPTDVVASGKARS